MVRRRIQHEIASRSNRTSWKAARRAAEQDNKYGDEVPLRVIHSDCCWCGAEKGHDWEGRAEGAPHPKVIRRN